MHLHRVKDLHLHQWLNQNQQWNLHPHPLGIALYHGRNHEIIGMKMIDVSKVESIGVFMRKILIRIHIE
jgi:hypothetical protein